MLLLTGYCALIVLASLAGGLIPLAVRLSHRRMELLLSFVSGVMFGVGVLHLLPHALMQRAAALGPGAAAALDGHDLLDPLLWWVLAGFLVMFLIERFFCYHHHDAPDGAPTRHEMTWTGAMIGMGMHGLVEGVALAASVVRVAGGDHAGALAGFGVFLAILLHKPFDALSLGTLAAAASVSRRTAHMLNGALGLAVPLGVVLVVMFSGPGAPDDGSPFVAGALAFSAGTFLCISLTDLLPELQFHSHDRVKLTVALLAGLAVAAAAGRLEAHMH